MKKANNSAKYDAQTKKCQEDPTQIHVRDISEGVITIIKTISQ